MSRLWGKASRRATASTMQALRLDLQGGGVVGGLLAVIAIAILLWWAGKEAAIEELRWMGSFVGALAILFIPLWVTNFFRAAGKLYEEKEAEASGLQVQIAPRLEVVKIEEQTEDPSGQGKLVRSRFLVVRNCGNARLDNCRPLIEELKDSGGDTFPKIRHQLLSPGEFSINAKATQRIRIVKLPDHDNEPFWLALATDKVRKVFPRSKPLHLNLCVTCSEGSEHYIQLDIDVDSNGHLRVRGKDGTRQIPES